MCQDWVFVISKLWVSLSVARGRPCAQVRCCCSQEGGTQKTLLFYPAKPQGLNDLTSALSSSLIHSSLPNAATCQISVGTHFSLLSSLTNFAYSFRYYLPYGYLQSKPSETQRSQLPIISCIIHRNLTCSTIWKPARFPPRYFVNGTCLVRNLLHCCICMLAFISPQGPPARPAHLWMQTAPLLSLHLTDSTSPIPTPAHTVLGLLPMIPSKRQLGHWHGSLLGPVHARALLGASPRWYMCCASSFVYFLYAKVQLGDYGFESVCISLPIIFTRSLALSFW